jgi:hypothetical protein
MLLSRFAQMIVYRRAADDDRPLRNFVEGRFRDLVHLGQRRVGHPGEHLRELDGLGFFVRKNDEERERFVGKVFDPVQISCGTKEMSPGLSSR